MYPLLRILLTGICFPQILIPARKFHFLFRLKLADNLLEKATLTMTFYIVYGFG